MFVFANIFFLTLTFHWQAKVFAKVQELFKDAPDLVTAFRDFLPGDSRGPSTRSWNTRGGRVDRMYAKL